MDCPYCPIIFALPFNGFICRYLLHRASGIRTCGLLNPIVLVTGPFPGTPIAHPGTSHIAPPHFPKRVSQTIVASRGAQCRTWRRRRIAGARGARASRRKGGSDLGKRAGRRIPLVYYDTSGEDYRRLRLSSRPIPIPANTDSWTVLTVLA
jgi:hypothetical protein